ncbi:MAG: FAD-dependent oxidoreductase [Candidatus Bathyarchaeota archaeon]|nr:FAD-dependent oxidoreductase [Candidatus Bathyarchaeota archaeon]
MSEEVYDVIIMGGGPAGLTSGIYTARHGLKTLLLEGKQLGGRSWGPQRIENYPGFPEGITGAELMDRFVAQAERFGVELREETIVGLSDMGETKMVQTRAGYYTAKAVVVTTGIQRKTMSVPGEMEFKGRGVSYCAICDGPFFKDRIVAVVGSGKEAVEDAIRLAETSKKVYTIPGRKGYVDEIDGLDELLGHESVEVIEGAEIRSIGGDRFVTHIELDHGSLDRLEVDGVFMILDHVGTSDIVKEAGVETDEGGCIIVDREQKTNVDGVFAAGDCVCGGMQVVTAAGDGGKAGLSALRYVRSIRK